MSKRPSSHGNLNTLRQAATNTTNAIMATANVTTVYDVPYDGTPYATIDPDMVHVNDLPPDATTEEIHEHIYQSLHETAHTVRRFDYALFTDPELKKLDPPYRLANLFIDGPVDHYLFGEYRGADAWRDAGRLRYQTKFLPESITPIDGNDRQALVTTAAGLVDCHVRAKTYPKSARALLVAFTQSGNGSIVPKLVAMAKDNGFIERFRHLYMDATANNTREILEAIRDLLALWEPHLPSSQGNPPPPDQPEDGDDEGGEQGQADGDSCDDDDSGDGEQESDSGEQDGDGGEQCGEQGSHGNSLLDELLDEHEVKVEQLNGNETSTQPVPKHGADIKKGKPSDPDNTGYIPASSKERWQYFVGRGTCTSADNRTRRWDPANERTQMNYHYATTGECIQGDNALFRRLMQECVESVAGKDANLQKLRTYLKAKYQVGKQYGQRSGKLNKRMAHRVVTDVPDPRWREKVFIKKTAAPDVRGTAISLALDISGSMSRTVYKDDTLNQAISRHDIAAGSIVKLAKALDMMGMEYEVTAYTLDWGCGGVVNVILKEFNERVPNGNLLRRLAAFSPMGANADGESISMIGERLLSMPHERKVLIAMSDGAPRNAGTMTPDYNDMWQEALRNGEPILDPEGGYLKGVVRNLMNQEVEVIGLGIDTDDVKLYYPHYRNVQAETLGEQLISVLKEII